jgi:glutamyl-tRNA synthetase/nondiscriminating glutamyl-tRNA synthetase
MTIIVNEEKKKLSKRDKNVIQFISEYAQMGYLPEAMFNFISLLGWSPSENEEILDQKAIIEQFDPKRLSKAPAMFDKDKLAYINSRYVKMLDVDTLAEKARPFLEKADIEIKDDAWLKTLVGLFQDRMSYIGQIVELYQAFFHDHFEIDDEAYQFLVENQSLDLLNAFKALLETSSFDAEEIQALIKQVGKDTNTKGKPLFMGLRIATTGDMHGPSLPVALALLGKEIVIKRLEQTMNRLRGDL